MGNYCSKSLGTIVQAKVKLSADFYKEVCPIGELDLDLKREIAYLVRRIAQDSQMIRDI